MAWGNSQGASNAPRVAACLASWQLVGRASAYCRGLTSSILEVRAPYGPSPPPKTLGRLALVMLSLVLSATLDDRVNSNRSHSYFLQRVGGDPRRSKSCE